MPHYFDILWYILACCALHCTDQEEQIRTKLSPVVMLKLNAMMQAGARQGRLHKCVHHGIHCQVRISILRPLQGRPCLSSQGWRGGQDHPQGQEDLPASMLTRSIHALHCPCSCSSCKFCSAFCSICSAHFLTCLPCIFVYL